LYYIKCVFYNPAAKLEKKTKKMIFFLGYRNLAVLYNRNKAKDNINLNLTLVSENKFIFAAL